MQVCPFCQKEYEPEITDQGFPLHVCKKVPTNSTYVFSAVTGAFICIENIAPTPQPQRESVSETERDSG